MDEVRIYADGKTHHFDRVFRIRRMKNNKIELSLSKEGGYKSNNKEWDEKYGIQYNGPRRSWGKTRILMTDDELMLLIQLLRSI